MIGDRQVQAWRGSPRWPQGQGFIAASSEKRAGKTSRARARTTLIEPSSSGWRRASSVSRRNSGSSSRKRTPRWARLASPGAGGRLLGGERVDLGHRDRLDLGQRRQQAREAARQQGLARTRRPEEEQVVAAGRGDLQGALGDLLAAHLGQVG